MIKFKIEGVSHLTDRLKLVKESVRNKWLRRAVDKASRIARKCIRPRITTGKSGWKSTGLYKKSIAVKIVNYGDGKIIGIVGADRSFSQVIRQRQKESRREVKLYKTIRGTEAKNRGQFIGKEFTGKTVTEVKKAGEDILHRPANIAHLIEYGHGGPGAAPAHPAFRPGWDEARGPALAAIRDTLEQGLVKELK